MVSSLKLCSIQTCSWSQFPVVSSSELHSTQMHLQLRLSCSLNVGLHSVQMHSWSRFPGVSSPWLRSMMMQLQLQLQFSCGLLVKAGLNKHVFVVAGFLWWQPLRRRMAWPLEKLVRGRSKGGRFFSLLMTTFDDFRSCRLMKRMAVISACSRTINDLNCRRRQSRVRLGAVLSVHNRGRGPNNPDPSNPDPRTSCRGGGYYDVDPPPPKFVSYGIGFVRHMFRIILREARGPIHHQFVLIARYVAKSAI